jgi:hypothetical protein
MLLLFSKFLLCKWSTIISWVVCTGFWLEFQQWISTKGSNKVHEKLTLLKRTTGPLPGLRLWGSPVSDHDLMKWCSLWLGTSRPGIIYSVNTLFLSVPGKSFQKLNVLPAWGSWQWTARTFHWNQAIGSWRQRQLIQVHQIGVSLIKYIKFTIILDCFNGKKGQLCPSFSKHFI